MNWDTIKGFKKREFAPPNPTPHPWDMDFDLMFTLHNLRDAATHENRNRIRFIIRNDGGFSLTSHSKKSLHGRYALGPAGLEHVPTEPILGRAADFTIEEEEIPGSNLWVPWSWLKQAAFVYGKIGPAHGLGIYPWWHRPGLHLDWRQENRERTPAVWTRGPDDVYIFRPFNQFYDLVDIILNWKEKTPEAGG